MFKLSNKNIGLVAVMATIMLVGWLVICNLVGWVVGLLTGSKVIGIVIFGVMTVLPVAFGWLSWMWISYLSYRYGLPAPEKEDA